MKAKLTIGAVWSDRKTGGRYELVAVNEAEGKVQLCPVGNSGAGYRIMSENSLRTNYHLEYVKAPSEPPPGYVAESQLEADDAEAATRREAVLDEPPAPEPTEADRQIAEAVHARGGRAPIGRVKLADGTVMAGAHFITKVAGKSRDDTYKVDSPIRWLLKPDGQALLKAHGAAIVYGESVTR